MISDSFLFNHETSVSDQYLLTISSIKWRYDTLSSIKWWYIFMKGVWALSYPEWSHNCGIIQAMLYMCALFCCWVRTKWRNGETRDVVECFSPLLECSSRFLSTFQQNRALSRLLYLFCNKESVKFPTYYFQFSKQTLFPKRTTVSSAFSILS